MADGSRGRHAFLIGRSVNKLRVPKTPRFTQQRSIAIGSTYSLLLRHRSNGFSEPTTFCAPAARSNEQESACIYDRGINSISLEQSTDIC